jgi:hypothetical protein
MHKCILFVSPQSGGWIDIIRYIRVSFVSLPRVVDELILSVWTKYEYCLSLPRVEDGLILSEYIRVSFVSLPREVVELTLSEWTKH